MRAVLFVLTGVFLVAQSALADPKPQGASLMLDATVIEGRFQKPEAYFILQRNAFDLFSFFSVTKQDLLGQIGEAIKLEPF